MGFFMQPWVLIVLALCATFFVVKWRRGKIKEKAQLDSVQVVVPKTTYRCRSCPQHFEPPHLFYVCPVCRSPVDKYENGVVVDEVNPAFPKAPPASLHGALPFIRQEGNENADKANKKAGKGVQKRAIGAPNDNVVAINTGALDSLQRTCWLVITAESSSLAQTLADQSPNFRVLYRKSPKRLTNNRWLVWGKARSAA